MYQYMLWYEAHHFNLSDFKSKFGLNGLKWVRFLGGWWSHGFTHDGPDLRDKEFETATDGYDATTSDEVSP